VEAPPVATFSKLVSPGAEPTSKTYVKTAPLDGCHVSVTLVPLTTAVSPLGALDCASRRPPVIETAAKKATAASNVLVFIVFPPCRCRGAIRRRSQVS
jgi:hypothetical protein